MERRQKICVIVKAFLEHPDYSMLELAELPEVQAAKISRKTISKYLTDPSIINLLGSETFNKVQLLFQNNRTNFKKRAMGKMIETKRSHMKTPVTSPKRRHIDYAHVLAFIRIKESHPELTIEQIAELYNLSQANGEVVDAQYVSDCLSEEAKNMAIQQMLNANKTDMSQVVEILDRTREK